MRCALVVLASVVRIGVGLGVGMLTGAGCGGRVVETRDDAASPSTDPDVGDTSSILPTADARPSVDSTPPTTDAIGPPTEVGPPPPDDAGPPPPPPPPPPPVDCAFTGPTHPETYQVYMFGREDPPGCGGAPRCAFSFAIQGCFAKLVFGDAPVVGVTLSPLDCDAFVRWVTSDEYEAAVNGATTLCAGVVETTNPETHELDGRAGSSIVRNKVPVECLAPPFERHRRCLQSVIDTYVPGKKL